LKFGGQIAKLKYNVIPEYTLSVSAIVYPSLHNEGWGIKCPVVLKLIWIELR
jgi:hypothetical protein